MGPNQKPNWPHAAICRMSAHMGAGQWYRTVNSKPIYFGVLRDPDAALRKYLAWAKNVSFGKRAPRTVTRENVTLHVGLNHFLTVRLADVDAGNLTARQYVRYRKGARLVISLLGKETLMSDLEPADFETLRSALTGGPRTVANAIRDIRVGLKWAADFYGVHVAYGQSFKRPSARAIKAATRKRQLFTAAEIRKLLAAAEPNMRAMIILGINCGFGQTDCAHLRLDCIDLCGHKFPRPKTGIDRRCIFWPETIAAIACRHRWRPDLRPELAFMSKYGQVLVRDDPILNDKGVIIGTRTKDAIQQMFRRTCTDAGVPYRPFYTFRHTFRSVADSTNDNTAIYAIMGWKLSGMDGVYLQLMADGAKRIKVVTDAVHHWLFDS